MEYGNPHPPNGYAQSVILLAETWNGQYSLIILLYVGSSSSFLQWRALNLFYYLDVSLQEILVPPLGGEVVVSGHLSSQARPTLCPTHAFVLPLEQERAAQPP